MRALKRVTQAEDIDQVAILAHEIWNEHFPCIIGQAQVDYMVRHLQSAQAITAQIDAGYEYYVLNLDDRPVGYLAMISDSAKGKILISKLYIEREARGTGLGQYLLNFVKDQSIQRSVTTIHLTVNRRNRSSVDWYRHHGFQITGEIDKNIGSGFIMDDYTMELPIG